MNIGDKVRALKSAGHNVDPGDIGKITAINGMMVTVEYDKALSGKPVIGGRVFAIGRANYSVLQIRKSTPPDDPVKTVNWTSASAELVK